MKKIALINQKGGTAKTTSTINIAGELVRRGERVLILDADSQGNATSNIGLYNPSQKSLSDVLLGDCDVTDIILHSSIDGLHLIPSNLELQYAEMNMQNTATRNDILLKKALKPIDESFYDFMIVDCSPSLSAMTINVLAYVDYVLIPIKVDKNSLEGYGRLQSVMDTIKEDSNPALTALGIFISAYESNIQLDRYIYNECKEQFGDLFIPVPIRKNVAVKEAPIQNLPVCFYDKNSNASKDYAALTDEILKRLGGADL